MVKNVVVITKSKHGICVKYVNGSLVSEGFRVHRRKGCNVGKAVELERVERRHGKERHGLAEPRNEGKGHSTQGRSHMAI